MAETWRVVTDDGTTHEVFVTKDGDLYEAKGIGWHGSTAGANARVAVVRVAATGHDMLGWPVREILAPGELSRVEVAAADADWRSYPPPVAAVLAHAKRAPCSRGGSFGLWLARNGDVLVEILAFAVTEDGVVIARALNGDLPNVVHLNGADVRPVGRNCEAMPHPVVAEAP